MPSNASAGYVGIATESTFGTAVTTPDFLYPMTDVDFSYEDEFIDIVEIRGSRQAMQVQEGAIRPEGSFGGAIYPEGAMGLILRGLLGSVTSEETETGSGAYAHTFGDADVLPSFTVERATGFSGTSGVFCERMAGAKVETVSFDCSFGEQVAFDATLQAAKRPISSTPITRASAVFPTSRPLYFGGATVKVNDVASSFFKSLNLEISNTLERQETLNGTRESYSIYEGGLTVTLSGTMVFEDMTYYDYLKNGTSFGVEIELNNQTYADTAETIYSGITFDMPSVRISSYGLPFTAGEVIEADVNFKVTYDEATAKTIGIVMINDEDGSAYV